MRRWFLFLMMALLATSVADAQTKIGSYPSGSALQGPELFLGNQQGTTVTFTANQIKDFTGTGGGGSGCASSCVTSFNGRSNVVSLNAGDISSALGALPLLPSNNLSDLGSAVTARTNLGLGTAAVANVGVTGPSVPLLNANNTFSGTSTFSGTTITSRRTVNTNTTLNAATDNVVCGDVSGGAITLTMPPNTLINGTTLMVDDCKRQSATTGHNLFVAANAGQTISGAASITISTAGGAVLLIWNATDNDWNLF